MCDQPCNRLHVDELGQVGRWIAKLAWATLKRAERDNGMFPRLPAGTLSLLQLLATSSRPRTASATINPGDGNRMTASDAARELGVSPVLVARWARQGRIRGARKQGQDWSLPTDAIDDLRRSRAA